MAERTTAPGSATLDPASVADPASPARSYGAHGSGSRTRVALACSVCDSRNYQTTRKTERQGQLALKKFCPGCNRHTVHKETK